jgi:hypothetical protein
MPSITDKISKAQFDHAYNHHLPSGWIKFAFKYFSRSTEMKDLSVKRTVVGILLGLFGLGFLATIIGLPKVLVGIPTIAYCMILATLVLYLFSAAFANNWRIRKIRKELWINKYEYDALVSAYYE